MRIHRRQVRLAAAPVAALGLLAAMPADAANHPHARGRRPGRRGLRLGLGTGLGVALVLLSACGPGAGPAVSNDLPGVSLARPHPGCTIVSVSPAVALPRESDGNGGYVGGRRAILRYEADCLPDVGDPSSWWQPYRISFEQGFSLPPERPGATPQWIVGDATAVVDLDHPSRPVDAATEARGSNCAVLLERIESETLPCVRAKDPQTGAGLQAALERYRAESRFTINVNGENDLNAVRLSRDKDCLFHWRLAQRQMETPLQVCAVN